MNKRQKIILICFASIVMVVVVIIGLVTRNSMVDDLSQSQYIDKDIMLQVWPEYNGVFKDDEIKTFDDLKESAEIIVKVKVDPDNKRTYFSDMTVSTVDVIQVYKGNIEDASISVIEPIFYYTEGNYIASIEEYYWMREDTEYILFLKKLKDAHIGKHQMIYLPTTGRYSKYNINASDDLQGGATGYYKYIEFRDIVLKNGII